MKSSLDFKGFRMQKYWLIQKKSTIFDWVKISSPKNTLNNHVLMDVWWNNHFLCNDLVHHPIETITKNWLFGVPDPQKIQPITWGFHHYRFGSFFRGTESDLLHKLLGEIVHFHSPRMWAGWSETETKTPRTGKLIIKNLAFVNKNTEASRLYVELCQRFGNFGNNNDDGNKKRWKPPSNFNWRAVKHLQPRVWIFRSRLWDPVDGWNPARVYHPDGPETRRK